MAQAGFAILGGSRRDSTADAQAFRGALSVPGSQLLVLRPASDSSEASDNEELRKVPLETLPDSKIRPKLIERADAVVLFSGTSKGTSEFYRLAGTRKIPIVLVPAFGGFVADAYTGHRSRYISDGIDEDTLKHLEHWDEKSPTAVETLLRRYLQLPASGADGSAQTPTGSATYLLTWDPQRNAFDNFSVQAREAEDKGAVVMRWNVGRADVPRGSRAFLMRHGSASPGLVGAGEIVGDAYQGEHWDKIKPSDWKTYYADVRWSFLGELPLVPLDALIQQTSESELWTREGSGLVVTKDVAARMEIAWRDALARKRPAIDPPRAWLESDAIPVIGKTRHSPSKYDSLDVNNQAEIFATLMVAKDVDPPFAFGLLGDWGVGKTFFMRLMQEKIASVAGKEANAEGISASVARAAQIEFNAWHYVDADLWASLASHIFDGLSQELSPSIDRVQDIRLRLRRTIRSSEQEKSDANAAIKSAQIERQIATKELEQKQAMRAPFAESREVLRLKRVWDAVMKVKPNPLNKDKANWPDLSDLKTKAERTARDLGIPDVINSAQEAQKVYQSMSDIAKRAGGLVAAFAGTFTGIKAVYSTLAIVAILAIVIAWPWILARIEAFRGGAQDGMANFLAPLLQLTTLVLPALIWASRKLNSVSSALSYLEQITAEIRQPREKLDPPTQAEIDLQGKIEKLDAEIATERRRLEEADRQIAQAQAEIQRINAGGLVYDFLNARVRDSRYLEKLGLISIIRQDFEQLGTLLHDWRKHGKNSGAEVPANATWDVRPIERIILYIDDLDRCPPQRVVDVLQAVHLILAFDLFVVVVAVDARWLQRSLNEAYNARAGAQINSASPEPIHQFSAHNYLEKIFQIPFTLPAMEETGFRKLVSNMTATLRKKLDHANAKDEPPHASKDEPQPEKPGEAKAAAADVLTSKVDPAGQSSRTEKELAAEAQQLQAQKEKAEAERKQTELLETQKRIKAMELQPWEEQFITALFPFVSTPRLAKRLLNIYRLLRVRAATRKKEEFDAFIDRDHGEYRAVLMLLAINVGHAEWAAEIFEVSERSQKSFREWLKKRFAVFEDERLRLSKDRESRKENEPPSRRESRLMELCQVVRVIGDHIDLVSHNLAELTAATFDDRLEKYEKWASEVGRYSFRWNY